MIDLSPILAAMVIGAGATALLDLWSLLLKKVGNIPSLSFCLVGRWFSLMRHGQFRHPKIGSAPTQPLECALGWTIHYLTGMLFALPLVLLNGGQWLVEPSLQWALVLGICTVLFPFLLMQPAFGMGIAAAKAPKPWSARTKSLLSHTVFGGGLYVAGMGYQWAVTQFGFA
ncbi:DUF2938 family protein [Rheinheimera riviphila]|uniref:DUF2938 family protein n=1 Tax=Rheinheimera riviphila TaxID=1834037 RepID=A0A437QGT7_9GAMM|nr:DUF2938 family protein [Rheinheimera riviphila]RVU33520.1 DUF2938 family protein [Rheinheimera riviphila]